MNTSQVHYWWVTTGTPNLDFCYSLFNRLPSQVFPSGAENPWSSQLLLSTLLPHSPSPPVLFLPHSAAKNFSRRVVYTCCTHFLTPDAIFKKNFFSITYLPFFVSVLRYIHYTFFHICEYISSEMTTQVPTTKLQVKLHMRHCSSLCDALSGGFFPHLPVEGDDSLESCVYRLFYIIILLYNTTSTTYG